MGGGWWVTLLGSVAALCSVGSFVPQVLKIRRELADHSLPDPLRKRATLLQLR
jgi:hypothetical protein